MSDPQTWTIRYLAARGDAPWRWLDDGNVLAWADGTTIAFRDEIAGILELLAPRGWPDFGALVWVLAACRGKLPPPSAPESHPGFNEAPLASTGDAQASERQMLLGHFEKRLKDMHSTVERGLADIARMPAEFRSSVRWKALLAEAIFHDASGSVPFPPMGVGLLSDIVKLIRSGALTDTMLNDPSLPPREGKREWIALCEGFPLDLEALKLRAKTGLETIPKAAPLPVIPAARMREVLSELKEDPEHTGLARLARDLTAALQLPRKLSEQDDLALGGFADIANRGSLDRLLLSELAHDDLTLAVRIAMGEALYLRREPPAKHPPSTLSILLDSGIRLWGAPRVLATAVALGLIAKSEQHGRLVAFRASGANVEPLDLLNKEGIVAHLGALETDPHPGAALPAFRASLREAERAEAVLVTQRDVLADAGFQRALAQADFDTLYLAVVDHDGSVELQRHPMGGTPICHARLDINAILNPPAAPARKSIERKEKADLPLILSQSPYPLRIAVLGRVMRAASSGSEGGVCVMRNRRLMKWENPRIGAVTICDELPRGETLFLREFPDGRICVVKATGGRQRLTCSVFAPDGALEHTHEWQFGEPVQRVESSGNEVIAFELRLATAFNYRTGARLDSHPISGPPFQGRYFRTGGYWSLLQWDGMVLRMAKVTLPAILNNADVKLLFDREDSEGPWVLTGSGELFSNEGERVMTMDTILYAHPHTNNTTRAAILYFVGGKKEILDLKTLRRRAVGHPTAKNEWEWLPPSVGRNLHTRFQQIAISGSGSIYLQSRKKGWWQITLATEDRLTLTKLPGAEPDVHEAISFIPVATRETPGINLKVARWSDGRCAWLDDRGMLHLRSANRTKPEVTIVLSEGRCSAHSTDGHWHGLTFFIGDHPVSSAAKLWYRISAFSLAPPK